MSDLRASIDIGSNSVLLLVASFENKEVKVLESLSEVTGLGKQLDKNKKFLDESMLATKEALTHYVNICKNYNLESTQILVTATEASRVSENSRDFFQEIKSHLGLNVKIITGEAEAEFSAKGILFDKEIKESMPVIMDIGGASTELIKVEKGTQNIVLSFSMPMGAVRFTNWLEDSILEEKLKNIKNDYKDRLAKIKTPYLHCVAGTMTSIANMHLRNNEFIESQVHGMELRVHDIKSLLEETKNYTPEEYLRIFPFLGKRSATIKGGLNLALSVFDWLEVEKVRISTYGLRYGVLMAGEIQDGYLA